MSSEWWKGGTSRRGWGGLIAGLCLAGGLTILRSSTAKVSSRQKKGARPAPAPRPIAKGERIFICGHSFHSAIAERLARLAKEAGIEGHVTAGVHFLGGSRPAEHWKIPTDKNPVKQALLSGRIDVLTLAPNTTIPDDGIDRFADLAVKHNPDVRVLLQISWAAFDGQDPGRFKVEDRDRVTQADLDGRFRPVREGYLARVRAQARSINERHKRTFVYLVPVGVALEKLRGEVIAGRVPGISKQSELFEDPTGHPAPPLWNLAAYCWFAAIYRRSPVGLTALETKRDDVSRRQQQVLEQIAWDAVLAEPYGGVK